MSSPIQQIPNEILTRIFIQCLPLRWQVTTSSSQAPVLLTRVCGHWRRVAIEAVELWLWLKVTIHESDIHRRTRYAVLQSLADLMLKRSKKGSLNLQVTIPHFSSRYIPAIINPLVLPVTKSLTRLSLKNVPTSQLRTLPESLFPNLERLVLRFQADTYAQIFRSAQQGPIKAFQDTPLLRYVALYRPSMESARVLLPWAQLTHAMVVDLNTGETLSNLLLKEDLPMCVKLRWLFIDLAATDLSLHGTPGGVSVIPIRTMKKIESLSLNFGSKIGGEFQYPDFFSNYKFPDLRNLRLGGGNMDLFGGTRHNLQLSKRFLDKVGNEFSSLEYLSICQLSVTPSTLSSIFKVTPQITTLDLHIYDNVGEVFKVLTFVSDPIQHLLPHLHTLILEVGWKSRGEEIVDPVFFLPFLDSRMRCKTNRLRKVIVYGSKPEHFSDERPFIKIIQQYAGEGLVLEIHEVLERKGGVFVMHWIDRDPGLQDWQEVGIVG